MADTPRPQTRSNQPSQADGEAERERSAPQPPGAAAEAGGGRRGAAASAAPQGGADMIRRGAEAAGEMAGEAGRAAGHGMRAAGAAAAETTRRTSRVLAEGGRELMDDAAGEFEEIGRRVARAVEETAGEMRRMMVLPRIANGALREAQQAMGELLDGMAAVNLRIAREIMRLADPTPVVDLQRRVVRECVGALMEGSTQVLRAARRSAEETLRPMEEELEQVRGGRRTEDGGGRWGQGGQRLQQQSSPSAGEVMRTGMRMVGPDETIQQAARLMSEEDVSVLPVGEEGRLLGVVTGRDLAVRLIAEGRDPARTRIREVMRTEPPCLFPDEDAGRAVETMAGQRLGGLPVVSRDDHRFLGLIALSDLTARQAAGGNGPLAAPGVRLWGGGGAPPGGGPPPGAPAGRETATPMKITLDIDCTPDEARRFFGLPDVAPLQEAVLRRMERQMLDAADALSPEALIRLWMPLAPATPEAVQRAMADLFRAPFARAGETTARRRGADGAPER
ncbi:DUF6489 family protein [Caldovatus aquaticus]|uniref:CBS domain-containing protein n=1 Tax=Caldovatus aquaticus TaxID=2865671 RepID=A0ABS7F150_9PROT|nr:DUF6489 family protein [Caldovatus aquaticus]MBW8269356.1 CBS domain-containing protein [Caldovatus aquaticus]